MTVILDYGVGNLYSLRCTFGALGAQTLVSRDWQEIAKARRIILPGVGAYADAMQKLRSSGLSQPLRRAVESGVPLLGICLGMQLLFETSREFGAHSGLGLIPGEVVPLADDLKAAGFGYKVPHMGWNPLHLKQPESPLLKNSREGDWMYYVHSFYVPGSHPNAIAASGYGVPVCGAVQKKNVFGTQFHPEKSGEAGLRLLRAFLEL